MNTEIRFERQHYERFRDRKPGGLFENLEFVQCRFDDCHASMNGRPGKRSTIRNITFNNCTERNCSLESAIVEEVIIDGLKNEYNPLKAWGAVFKHVTLKGKIDRIMISAGHFPTSSTPAEEQALAESNAEYYKTVDWALDISQGQFRECDLRGMPARLVRRDPHTQFVITREKALEGKWKTIDLAGIYWNHAILYLIDFNITDMVLVAPKRSPKFKILWERLLRLRDAGVVE